jgi:hypothetical protein
MALVALAAASAQDTAAIAPATAPVPSTRPRRAVSVPPGFTLIQSGGRAALAEAADESWVRARLEAMKPATRPAIAGQILARVRAQKDQLIKQLMGDLALEDAKALSDLYDTYIITPVQQIDTMDLHIFYLVANRDRLKEILRNGWQDPNFYYNRAADAVAMASNIALRPDAPNDDAVLGAIYAPDDKPDQRTAQLTNLIAKTESDTAAFLNARARFSVGAGFATVINEVALKPLDLKDDQRWFTLGVDMLLAIRYSSPLTDQPQADLIKEMTSDNPRNPVRPGAVNLLHPPDLNALVPESAHLYVDAVRRKSAAVMNKILDQAGPSLVPKSLAAIRAKKPADGPALVKILQELGGMDLTKDLTE